MDTSELESLIGFRERYKLTPVFLTTRLRSDTSDAISKFEERSGCECPIITREDIGANKGSPKWLKEVERRTAVTANRVLFIGRTDSPWDWKTAINGGAFFIGLDYREIDDDVREYALILPNIQETLAFVEVLFGDCDAYYTYRRDYETLIFRSLFDAGTTLNIGGDRSITLQDVFTYESLPQETLVKARYILALLFLVQLWKEEYLMSGVRLTMYPSHLAGTEDRKFMPYLRAFRGIAKTYVKGLLKRTEETMDKSVLRAEKRHSEISFDREFSTLALKDSARIRDRVVVVFDDFSTSGMSLECARILLENANVRKVVLCAIGKYGVTHTIYDQSGREIQRIRLSKDQEAERTLRDVFHQLFTRYKF